jgi:hypothetical protein
MNLFRGIVIGCALTAGAARATPETTDEGFHLEGHTTIDDVFGDAADYRRTIDRFLELTTEMQAMRDQFARAVQAALAELNKAGEKGKRRCPEATVANPYALARKLGGEYLRVGRELTRHHEQIREFDRLGETVGLTPDYRWKVKRVLTVYGQLLTDYREMKVALHDQLDDELRFAGCDLNALQLKGDPQAKLAIDEKWPQPGEPGAPGVPTPRSDREPHDTLPRDLPIERVPPPAPIPVPKRATTPGDTQQARSGILFYVDNTRCQRATQVWLDGKKLGDVAAATRVGFQAAAGPHDLCLLDDGKKQCGQPGTVRRSYLHESWTISLRCE